MSGDKVVIDFLDIRERIKQCALPDVDRVVGIGSGGIVPAALVAYQLGRPLTHLPINYRDDGNKPLYEKPQILADITIPQNDQHLLIVDDVSVSGMTLAAAKMVLDGFQITTLVMKGQADIVLFPEIDACVLWPWK